MNQSLSGNLIAIATIVDTLWLTGFKYIIEFTIYGIILRIHFPIYGKLEEKAR